jgi:2-polyprenyl-3-methyl-5-hydroxy-6-metoxy-1,4-benzoquinol methylase
VRCGQCGMIYVNPVPAEFASGQYYDQTGSEYYLSAAKLESDYAEVRFERELRLFRRHCGAGAVLDVGCSSGAFLYQLNRRFPEQYEILGTDASRPALDYAQTRGVPTVRGDFLRQDFGGKRFDAVTFWAVLEHLADPELFLEKAWSVLKPKGLCFVLVPNMSSLAARVLGVSYRYIYPQHLNYFTQGTLRRLVQLRFTVVERRFTHFNPVVIWQDWRRGNREVSNRERGALLQRTTAYKQSRLLAPARVGYKLAEKMLGALGLADNVAMVLRRRELK